MIREPAGRHAEVDPDLRHGRHVLSATSIGVLLTFTNTSTLDVALPSIVRSLRAGPTEAGWILLGYMLVNTLLLLVFGRLADLVGRRGLYLTGLALFTAASIGCGLSGSAGTLIAMRMATAVGAAAIITNTTALLADAHPAARLPAALGLNATVAASSQMLGPALGGLLVQHLGWRSLFWVDVPVGLIGLGWAASVLRPPAARPAERFDWTGALLSGVALSGLIVVMSEGGLLGWTSPVVLAAFCAFVVGLPCFLAVQAVAHAPLVDLRLFADPRRAGAYVGAFLMSGVQFATVLLMSLYLQSIGHMTPLQAGLRIVPVALGMAVTAPLAGRWAGRFREGSLPMAGTLVAACGLALVLVSLRDAAAPDLQGSGPRGLSLRDPGLLFIGIGTGLFMTPNTSAIMSGVGLDRRGIANGVRAMSQNAGFLIGTALSLAIATWPLSPSLRQAIYAGSMPTVLGSPSDALAAGFRNAVLGLIALCLAATAISLARTRRLPRGSIDHLSQDGRAS